MPVNDMLDGSLQPERLVFHDTDNNNSTLPVTARLNLGNASVELVEPVPSSSMVVTYQVSVMMLLGQALQDFSLTLCLLLVLLLLSLLSSLTLRRMRAPEQSTHNPELDLLRLLNKEMVDSLPVGFVIYDFNAHREVVSNEKAAHLIPHLNMQKIVSLSENAQGYYSSLSIMKCMRSAISKASALHNTASLSFVTKIVKFWSIKTATCAAGVGQKSSDTAPAAGQYRQSLPPPSITLA